MNYSDIGKAEIEYFLIHGASKEQVKENKKIKFTKAQLDKEQHQLSKFRYRKLILKE